MADLYSRVDLSTKSAGQPGPLPPELIGLTDATLADLPKALDPVPAQFAGVGYWPVAIEPVEFDPRARTTDGTHALTLDVTARTVSAVPNLRNLKAEEIAALPPMPEPQPKPLGRLGFIRHVQATGGMTDQMLVDARNSPAFAALWI